MVRPAGERRNGAVESLLALLAPSPGRLEFAARLALVCALAILVAQIYQTPEPALTAYVAFFVVKRDRTTSVVVSVVMIVLITLVIAMLLVTTILVIDQPMWRVTAMTLISFFLLFAASASKLKPVAAIIALITAYGLDLLGTVHGGEEATRALLYAWLFVGIPASVSIAVNLLFGPAPRHLAEQQMAKRLRLAAVMLRGPDNVAQTDFDECLREGTAEVSELLKMAGLEKSAPPSDILMLRHAAQTISVLLSVVDYISRTPEAQLPPLAAERIARTLDCFAVALQHGTHLPKVPADAGEGDERLAPPAAEALAELRAAVRMLTGEPPPPAQSGAPRLGFFSADAFANSAHTQYALKTTAAAMFCYIFYSLLDWPGIHTCLITCYIVSLGTTAETAEKLTLRVLGCMIGAAVGTAALVFLMPAVASIGALMAIIFVAALLSGWVAAGSPRISYIGFQLAFAFFLCVVQGPSPAFDMTIARDRLIGILLGNIVVAVIFTQIWPVTVASRIDPAIASLLRRLAVLASSGVRLTRWAQAVEARAALSALQQDLELTRYEPTSIGPAQEWLDHRRRIGESLALLEGAVLIGADQDPSSLDGVSRRLQLLASKFSEDLDANGAIEVRDSYWVSEVGKSSGPDGLRAFVEAPLEWLEQAAMHPSVRGV